MKRIGMCQKKHQIKKLFCNACLMLTKNNYNYWQKTIGLHHRLQVQARHHLW